MVSSQLKGLFMGCSPEWEKLWCIKGCWWEQWEVKFSKTNDSNSWWHVDLRTLVCSWDSINIENCWCKDTNDPRGCLCNLSNATISMLDENDTAIATTISHLHVIYLAFQMLEKSSCSSQLKINLFKSLKYVCSHLASILLMDMEKHNHLPGWFYSEV